MTNIHTDVLGFPEGWAGRSDWTYRTYRTIFLGWTTEKDGTTPMYRDTTPISQLKAVDEQTVFYPVFVSALDAMTLGELITEDKGAVIINQDETAASTLHSEAVVKEDVGFKDDTATDKSAIYYYDATKTEYHVNLNSNFKFTDTRIPALVAENPLSIIKSAKGITDFSGESPTDYTYEDLIVELDDRVTVASEMTDLEFSSALFMVAAVLDENYQPLDATIIQPTDGELVTKFSFKNPDLKKKFIVRTVVRNYGDYRATTDNPYSTVATATGEEVFGTMQLTSGSATNITVSKDTAKELALSGQALVFSGKIGGKIVWDASKLPFPFNLFVPDSSTIETMDSINTVHVDFVLNKVTFNKNSVALGDTDTAQTVSEVNVEHDKTIAGDEFTDQSIPADPASFTVDGVTYVFSGWNTQADGNGETFTEDTVVSNDIEVYAQWKKVLTTKWVDVDTKEDLKLAESSVDVQTAGEFEGYEFVETTVDGTTTTHWFKKATPVVPVDPTPTPDPTPVDPKPIEPTKPEPVAPKEEPADKKNEPSLPNTGSNEVSVFVPAVLSILSGLGLVAPTMKKRKK